MSSPDFGVATVHHNPGGDDAEHANAALIAEAGTVYHETGLRPRQLHQHLEIAFSMQRRLEDDVSQLARQRDELLALVKRAEQLPDESPAYLIPHDFGQSARAAIAKAEGRP